MSINRNGINIETISGGIVNFGGAVYISPISVTKTVSGSGETNSGASTSTTSLLNPSDQRAVADFIDVIRRSLA